MTRWLAALLLIVATGAHADSGPVARFPQPVRAGDLIGRELLEPKESQPLLGHVEGVEKLGDGSIALRVRMSSLLPWRKRSVDVPVAAVALLGEHVGLLDLTPAQLDSLPDAPQATPISPDEQIRVGLVRPFH